MDDIIIKERKRWIFFGLPFSFTTYTLFEKKLVINSGLFTSVEDEILLYRIMDLSIKRTLWQKIFNLGSIIVLSQDKTTPKFEIKNIRNTKKFKDTLSKLIEDDKNRLRMRRGEVLGGFDSEDDLDDENLDI